MNFTTTLMWIAQDAPAGGAGGQAPAAPGLFDLGGMLIPMILCFGVFWLLVLRPESKQRKKRQQMLSELKKGDRVMTTGGLYGKIVQVQDSVVTLEVADGVRMRFALTAVQSVETEAPAGAERAIEAKT